LAVDEVEFRLKQRVQLVCWGAFSATWPLLAGGLRLFTNQRHPLILTAGVAGILLAVITINMAFGRTTIDSAGVRTWRPLRRRTCAWHEIEAITVREEGGGGGGLDFKIEIHKTNGRSFKLPAPMDSSNGRDPHFNDKAQQIRNRWATATGRDQETGTT
jgi:hypothetical protein